MCLPMKSTTSSEIQYIINKMPENEALGNDSITNLIIKHFAKKAIIFLTHSYNSIL